MVTIGEIITAIDIKHKMEWTDCTAHSEIIALAMCHLPDLRYVTHSSYGAPSPAEPKGVTLLSWIPVNSLLVGRQGPYHPKKNPPPMLYPAGYRRVSDTCQPEKKAVPTSPPKPRPYRPDKNTPLELYTRPACKI